jgi:hypothetical protein
MNTQLLCTFTDTKSVYQDLENIKNTYNLVYSYIYVLQNIANLDELYITYNIDTAFNNHKPLRNTILMHRKKHTNTLYTINTLNQLIKEENDGILDKSFEIDWAKFRNTIIVTNKEGTKQIKTKIFEIIEL